MPVHLETPLCPIRFRNPSVGVRTTMCPFICIVVNDDAAKPRSQTVRLLTVVECMLSSISCDIRDDEIFCIVHMPDTHSTGTYTHICSNTNSLYQVLPRYRI